MLKVNVYYEEEGEIIKEEVRNLRPRTYMTGWSFEKMVKYIKEECSWQGINVNKIEEIVLQNEREQWQVVITKECN